MGWGAPSATGQFEKNSDRRENCWGAERRGRERGLIYKTLILTGLRRGELASLTVGQLELDGPVPFARLNAADEKNRQGNSIPLRADLVADLREWLEAKLHDERTAALRNGQVVPSRLGPDTPIVNVPASLVRTLDRDLQAAGIPKRDERGRVVDVHALRHSFGTMLSRNGVAPRTAQAALRHSTIDLTMNVYTDPKLLDIHGALESLPKFDLKNDPRPERIALKSTGTDPNPLSLVAPTVAPDVARNVGNPRKSLSLAVQTNTSFESRIRSSRTATGEAFVNKNAEQSSNGHEKREVGETGFEPAAFWSQTRRSSQAELHPEVSSLTLDTEST